MTDPPLTEDPETGVPLERVFHPIAVHFKGKGFYNTDYGTKKRAREKAGERVVAPRRTTPKSGDAKTETKSEPAKTEAKASTSTASSDSPKKSAASKRPPRHRRFCLFRSSFRGSRPISALMDGNAPICRCARAALAVLAFLTIAYAAQVSFDLVGRPSADTLEKLIDERRLPRRCAPLRLAGRRNPGRARRVGVPRRSARAVGPGRHLLRYLPLGSARGPDPVVGRRGLPRALSAAVRGARPALPRPWRRRRRPLWVDGAIGALAMAALAAMLSLRLFDGARSTARGPRSRRASRIRSATCCSSRCSAAPSR